MASNNALTALPRPKGLAARAAAFTAALMLVTAILSAATIVFGACRESARHQIRVTSDLTAHLANVSGNLIAANDIRDLAQLVTIASSRREVRRLLVRDVQGGLLAAHGGSAADAAAADALAARVAASGRPDYLRTSDDGLALAAPIDHNGERLGVAVMMWNGDAYRFNALPALAPFFLILICLVGAAVPLTARFARKAIAPLDDLARFAERVADDAQSAAPIVIRSGDEFETVANAFNKMLARIDASMRRIQEMAFVDPATQLPNHDRFVRETNFFILQAKDEIGAVALFELQWLSKLTQTLDPAAARDLLRVAGSRFSRAVQHVDRLVRATAHAGGAPVAARIGVAEFAVLAPGLSSAAQAARYAQQLTAALNQPFEWRGHKLTLGARCGVALAPQDGGDAESVIRRARMALAAAQSGRAWLKVYTRSLDREAMARLTLEREMRGALERSEFRAYFQPKVNLATGRIDACEALARWVRPDRTIISPGRFIPVAEESGLIGPLSDAIMREACWKAAAWARAGHPAKVAVNVSALQFRDDRFADNVLRIIRHSTLSADQLELEITESVVMEDPDRALKIIAPLREAGVRLAIDDFGCGQSSLSALSKLPFDVIKIDQQFVRALERGDEQAPTLVEIMLEMARRLGMKVVAEGVERREEMEFMAARGCHWAQGFLYGAAVSADEFAETLRRQAQPDAAASAA